MQKIKITSDWFKPMSEVEFSKIKNMTNKIVLILAAVDRVYVSNMRHLSPKGSYYIVVPTTFERNKGVRHGAFEYLKDAFNVGAGCIQIPNESLWGSNVVIEEVVKFFSEDISSMDCHLKVDHIESKSNNDSVGYGYGEGLFCEKYVNKNETFNTDFINRSFGTSGFGPDYDSRNTDYDCNPFRNLILSIAFFNLRFYNKNGIPFLFKKNIIKRHEIKSLDLYCCQTLKKNEFLHDLKVLNQEVLHILNDDCTPIQMSSLSEKLKQISIITDGLSEYSHAISKTQNLQY